MLRASFSHLDGSEAIAVGCGPHDEPLPHAFLGGGTERLEVRCLDILLEQLQLLLLLLLVLVAITSVEAR